MEECDQSCDICGSHKDIKRTVSLSQKGSRYLCWVCRSWRKAEAEGR